MGKKHYARLHILEILFENTFLFKKINFIYTKDKKKLQMNQKNSSKFKCITKKKLHVKQAI